MPASRLRRPLFLLTCLTIVSLAALRLLGVFSTIPGPELRSWTQFPSVQAEGTAASMVREERGAHRFILQTNRVASTHRDLRLLVHLPRRLKLNVRPGDRLEISGRLRSPRRPRNPGDFDERAYLHDRRIDAVLWVSTAALTLESSWKLTPERWGAALRQSLQSAIRSACPPPHDAVLLGIVLGDKHALDAPLRNALKTAGAIHIIVPSGTNVAFIVTFGLWLCLRLRLPPWLRLILPLLPAGLYGLVVGADPPYLRAYLGAALAVTAKGFDRGWDSFQALTLAALILLLHDPRILFLPGFQMSFLVVFAILAAEPGQRFPRSYPLWIRKPMEILFVGVVAQLALAPLLAGMGGIISVLGLLANVLLIPLSGLILGFGFLLWLAWLLPHTWGFSACATAASILASIFREICLAAASWPAASWELAPFGAWNTLCWYLLLIALFYCRRPRSAAALGASTLCLWTAGFCVRQVRSPIFEVLALTRARGSCLIQFPDGRRWLIYNNGPASPPLRALKLENARHLDRLVWIAPDRQGRRSLSKIVRAIPTHRIMVWKGPEFFEHAQEGLLLRFGGPEGLRAFNRRAELRRVPEQLRWKALRILYDGENASIHDA